MSTVRKIKLKPPIIKFLKAILFIIVLILGVFLFYRYEIYTIKKLGYNEKSSNYILFHGLKDYVEPLGNNKTLNEAFSSPDYIEENLDHYKNIKYVKQNYFISNINTLIEKGYSNRNINLIFAHGNGEDVREFAKRDKVRYLEEFFSVSYAKLRNYDRYVKYSDETGEDDDVTVLIVNLDLDKENYVDPIIVKEFSTTMLVNKHRQLQEDFEPDNLVKIPEPYASDNDLLGSREAVDAFKLMYKAAKDEGFGIVINSAYRSYKDQEETCNTYRNLYGDNYVNKYVARPGFSEHQTGLGFDIGSTTTSVFKNSKEYQWMEDNAYKYGFILRFPQKWVIYTGFNPEPWHYRYVGKEISTYIHEHNIPFEEYYAMFLDD